MILRKTMKNRSSTVYYYLIDKNNRIVSWNNGNVSVISNISYKKGHNNSSSSRIEESPKTEEPQIYKESIDLGKMLEDSVSDFNFEDFTLY